MKQPHPESLWLAEKANEAAKIGYWELDLISNKLVWSKITKLIHDLDENVEPDLENAINFYKEGESRKVITEAVEKAIAFGLDYDIEVSIITPKGKEKWVRTIGQSLFENGKCIKLFGTFQDIDSQKLTTLALSTEKLRNEQILASSGLGTWEWNVQTGETIFNEKWAEILGYTLQELLPISIQTWDQLVHPDDLEESDKLLQQCFNGTKSFYETEARMKHKNGSWVWVYDRGMVISRTEEGEPLMMFGIHQDITKRKNAETELFGVISLVKSQNVKFKNYSHIVNHNLRSHAGNIKRLLELALDTDESAEQEELLTFTQTAAKNLLDTIGNLSKMTNVNDDITNQLEDLSLSKATQKAVENVLGLANVSAIQIRNEVPFDFYVKAIPAFLDSIILNLLTNAIKYSTQERLPEIVIKASENQEFVILAVQDNGLGIDLKKHGEKLFGMYQTFHNNNKEARGIGLFLTKTQIEAMGGLIEVESASNVGSTFSVFFKK